MRMRRLRSPGPGTPVGVEAPPAASACAVLAIAALLLVAGASGADEPDGSAAGWESLLGDRPVGAARWTLDRRAREAVARDSCRGGRRRRHRGAGACAGRLPHEQRSARCSTRLAFKGAPIEPEHAYYRVFNGFATAARCPLARDRGSRSRREGSLSRAGGDPRRGRSRQRRRSPGRRRRQAARRRHPRLLRAPASRWRCSTRASISCTRTSAAP